MSEQLYINNELIDLPDRVVSQTKQINDIGEIKDRQANYSNNIKIPRTAHNIATLEMLGIAGNTTRFPYENGIIKYVNDGIELITDGKGVIKNTNGDYNMVIYDGNISMSDLLGSSTLEQLDYSAYNHLLTQSIFFNSFVNTSGYVYSLGNFFDNPVNFDLNLSFISPSFFIHTLFSMIFGQKGYTVSGDIFTNADYLSRVVSMNRGYERIISEDLTQVYTRDNSGDPSVSDVFPATTIQDYIIDTYNAVESVTHRIITSGSLTVTTALSSSIKVKLNGVLVHSEPISTGTGIYPVNFEFDIAVNSGDVVTLELSFVSKAVATVETIAFENNYTSTILENDLSIPVNFKTLIGEETQIGFVKDIMQRFGLIFRKVRNVNEFEFIQMEELLKDRADAEDWSSKYSNFKNEEYKPNYARVNNLKCKYDDSDGEPTFGDGIIEAANVNLEPEKDLLTSIFKASEQDQEGLYILKHWILEETDGVISYEPNIDDLRIFKNNLESTTLNFRFSEDIKSFRPFIGSAPFLDFKSLYYQREIDKYYSEFENVLDSYKKLTLSINLNLVDLYQLDFFKLKYFNQLGRYFYLNKVSNFKKNKTTACEFIEVEDRLLVGGNIAGLSVGLSTVIGSLSTIDTDELVGVSNGVATVIGFLTIEL